MGLWAQDVHKMQRVNASEEKRCAGDSAKSDHVSCLNYSFELFANATYIAESARTSGIRLPLYPGRFRM